MENKKWMTVIKPKSSWRDIDLKELWQYRDLIYLFVKRNFATMYKQTVLGPAWIIINPLFSTLISTFVFGNIAKLSSDGVPYFLFYMCGITVWNYFSTCLTNTSSTFVGNARLFGKVYFPRLAVPVSTVITGLMNFVIQLFMFIIFSVWHIIYSTSAIASEKLLFVCRLNPMTPVVEVMRHAFLGTGEIDFLSWGISIAVTAVILFVGVVLFNKVEKTFMDTV